MVAIAMTATLAATTATIAARYRCNMEFPRRINSHLVRFVAAVVPGEQRRARQAYRVTPHGKALQERFVEYE